MSGAARGGAPREVRHAVAVFPVHLDFNVDRSAAFHGLREVSWALAVIWVLRLQIIATMWAFDRVDRLAALLLVPYRRRGTSGTVLNYRS